MKKLHHEKGQALILIALAAIGLFAFSALAIDGSRIFSDRRHAQNAADASAMAASLARIRGQNLFTAGLNLAASNGYDNSPKSSVAITLTDTPSGVCPSTGKDIQVTIVSHVSMTFARVIGRNEMINTVNATARSCDVKVAASGPLYSGASVYATKTAACGNGINGKSLYVQGSSKLQIWGGDMGSASTDGNCIYFKGGEAQLKKAESGTACADVVTAAPSGGTYNSLKGQDGCGKKVYGQTFENPPDDLGITCSGTATKTGSNITPGNFTGTFPPAGVTFLQPGIYCIDGEFKVNAGDKLTGYGVTIVMKSGNLRWNGNSEIKLAAPTNGSYKGLLIYFPPGNSSPVDVDGNANAKITGTILAQNSDCYFAGSGQLQKQVLQFICYTWGMNGNGQAEIVYDSSLFFSPVRITNPTISLLK